MAKYNRHGIAGEPAISHSQLPPQNCLGVFGCCLAIHKLYKWGKESEGANLETAAPKPHNIITVRLLSLPSLCIITMVTIKNCLVQMQYMLSLRLKLNAVLWEIFRPATEKEKCPDGGWLRPSTHGRIEFFISYSSSILAWVIAVVHAWRDSWLGWTAPDSRDDLTAKRPAGQAFTTRGKHFKFSVEALFSHEIL